MVDREQLIDLIPDDIHFKTDQLADLLDIKVRTIRDWCYKGYLRSSNPGGSHRISGSELKRYLLENSNQQIRQKSLLKFLNDYDFDTWESRIKHTGENMLLSEVFSLISDNGLYSTSQLSEYLGVTPLLVRQWIFKGDIRSVTPKGKDIRIIGKDIKVLMYNRLKKKYSSNE